MIRSQAVRSYEVPWPKDITPVRWTDDYSSVAALIDWSPGIDWEKMGLQLRKVKQENAETNVTVNKSLKKAD